MKEKLSQNTKVIIFDLDGTLYQLDGENNGFKGSMLETKVNENAIKFIAEYEKLESESAIKIFNDAAADLTGISSFLSKRYKITREEYFNKVWDINPSEIIKNYKLSVKIVNEMALAGCKLILLTSAPKIWAKKVLETINVERFFTKIYTGEDFGTKSEIFKLLSQTYEPTRMVSVGDQEKTDISPAEILGIKGILIRSPEDMGLLSELLEL